MAQFLGNRFLYVLVFLTTVFAVQARHIVGGEVTYECIGQPNATSRTYRVQVSLYRDALSGGADFDSGNNNTPVFEMTIFEGGRVYRTIQIRRADLAISEFTIVDPDPCVVYPPNVRTQRGVYTVDLTLPISTQTYTIAYQRCCRNETISNLIDPGQVGATYMVDIPPLAQQSCNSSPVFNNFAPIVICANTELVFDHSATDMDGDRLVYSLCDPYLGGGPGSGGNGNNEGPNGITPNPETPPPYQSVAFRAPFTIASPIDSDPPFSIDPNTGQLRVRPRTLGVFVVCLSVQEYRNGELIGEVRRDFQFNVVDCEPLIMANVDSPAAVDSLSFGFIQFCGTRDIELFNTSTDRRFIDEISWVLRGTTEGTLTSGEETMYATYPDYGLYPASLVVNPNLNCSDTLDFTIRLTPPTYSDFEFFYDTCSFAPVQFENNSFTDADSVVFYQWDFGGGGTSTEFEPLHSYQQAGNRTITLTVRDNFGCEVTSEKDISFFPVPTSLDAFVLGDRGCAPEIAEFRQGTQLITEEYEVFWDFGDGTTSTELNPNHQYLEPGDYPIYVSATSPFGCFVDSQFSTALRIFESPIADFIIDGEDIDIRDPTYKFFDQSVNAVSWQWFFDSVGTSREIDPVFSFPDTGSYKIDLIVSHLNGCRDSTTQYLRIAPYHSYFLPNAFTPDRNGLNELFRGAGYFDLLSDFEMLIYNRWGEQIFETNDIYGGWDGINMRNGKVSPPGVYIYIVTYTDPDGPQKLTGYVTLVR